MMDVQQLGTFGAGCIKEDLTTEGITATSNSTAAKVGSSCNRQCKEDLITRKG